MFPIRDHNPSRKIAYVSYALIAINVIVFLTYFSMPEPELTSYFCQYGLVPLEISNALGLLGDAGLSEALTNQDFVCYLPRDLAAGQVSAGAAAYDGLLFTMFLHGGWMHLLGNMLFLYIFGNNMEDFFGHVGFLAFYLIGGLAASALHIAVGPTSTVPTVGASGAIAAVMGGYLLLYPKARVDVLIVLGWFINIIAVPAWAMLGLWILLQIGSGVVNLGATGGGVAYWAHAGGFAAGALIVGLALLMGRRAHSEEGHPANPVVSYRVRKGPWG